MYNIDYDPWTKKALTKHEIRWQKMKKIKIQSSLSKIHPSILIIISNIIARKWMEAEQKPTITNFKKRKKNTEEQCDALFLSRSNSKLQMNEQITPSRTRTVPILVLTGSIFKSILQRANSLRCRCPQFPHWRRRECKWPRLDLTPLGANLQH